MNVMKMMSLENKVAVVTGGAGLYGRQIVDGLAEAGARTVVASRGLEKLQELAAEHRDRGHDVVAHRLDQSEEESVLQLRDDVLEQFGRIDVLVNNAVARPMSGWDDDADSFDESMRVNATGIFLMTRAFGEPMRQERAGSIINVSSIMGMIGVEPTNYRGTDMSGFYPDYYFHKGGMINFTRFCASYFGDTGVRVNCVSPGGLYNDQPEPFVRQYSERTCLGRMADETDLKGAIVFLASDASKYVTGANLPVDGGYTAK